MLRVALGLIAFGWTVSAAADEPIPLRVLYAGKIGHPRTEDFRGFLARHFQRVAVANFPTLSDKDADPHDVVILDWPDLPPRNEKTGEPMIPALSRDYSRPTVLIGGGSLFLTRKLELKLGDFCVCLGNRAHGMELDHEIFHTPFAVKIEIENRPTPRHYRAGFRGESLGETIPTWKVQERGWSIDSPTSDEKVPGMVSYPHGLTDSPDCEMIASGLNLKSPDAAAIARQANFLLWGFHAAPSDLTPEARKCFLNAIRYITKFDGERPLVRTNQPYSAREWMLDYAAYGKLKTDRARVLESLSKNVRDDSAKAEESFRAGLESWRRMFPKALMDAVGNEPDKVVAYYRDNVEFLRYTGKRPVLFEVDEDVRGLGLSNRSVELLDRCVGMLERGERPDLAAGILKRYTNESFDDAKAWRSWLEGARTRLFFTDLGGYKFMVAPAGFKRRPARVDVSGRFGTKDEGDPSPVAARGYFTKPLVARGDQAEFVLEIKLAPSWHIQDLDRTGRSSTATTATLELPKGLEPAGRWTSPAAAKGLDGKPILAGSFEFRRPIRVAGDVEPGKSTCRVVFTACDPFHCRARESLVVRAEAP